MKKRYTKGSWCRKKDENGKYKYVLVAYEMALVLHMKQGFEIHINPKEIPEEAKKEWSNYEKNRK